MISLKPILTALFFSIFIYLEHFNIVIPFLNTVFALLSFSIIFYLTKKELFVAGFFIGILWFWWIGYSFIYYELSYLIPVILICIGIVYGILFYLIGLMNNVYYRLITIFLLSFIEPFGFNWFKVELPFINSYFGTSKLEFFLILGSLALFINYKDKFKKESIVFLSSSLFLLFIYNNNYNKVVINKPVLDIEEHNTTIPQEEKWKQTYKRNIINDNINAINIAIEKKKDLIVLPETAFPIVLNHNEEINNLLKIKSFEIAIITGSLYAKDGLLYNSTYFYQNGVVEVAHKVVLVPFGEAVPMPEKIRNLINDIFYDGAKDYETAKYPTTFKIKGILFRNAICYEITSDEIYKNLDTPYIIGTSNNAWFTPSIQPALQKILMKYYQKKYKLFYINVSNQ